jgi:3-oxoadipate enol-lactonase
VRLPHDDVGRGPAIVLLHAGVADRRIWTEHLEPLAAAGHRVIAVDLPGFGEARDESPAPWLDVLETLDALGVERAAVVGNSFGAAVALRVAAASPERVTALVLISGRPPGAEPSPVLRAAWDAEESAIERGDVDGAIAAVVDAWTLPDAPPEVREHVSAMQRRAYEIQLNAPEPEQAPDPLVELAALDVPAVVAVGEHEMPDFVQGADSLARSLPRARHAVIAGAGHLAPLEAPDAFRRLVLEALR